MSHCNDFNNTLLDATYKDDSPVKTVEKIKAILGKYGIQTTERWSESGVEHCYSLRVSVDNTNFGVNGKGLTKEFALASAYGELMERMQLGLFSDSSVQKIGHYSEVVSVDEMFSAKELYSELPFWYDFLAEKANELDNSQRSGYDMLSSYENELGEISAVSFYNLMSKKRVHIPRELRAIVCGSNGGAAGNTMEEAIVQAISEIFERNYQQRIVKGLINPPAIPESVLKGFKVAYSIISNLRSMGFEITVKDCSLGGKFPVVCVCYIDKRTGKYHTHFGAYPVLEIAIERALTESFQGRSVDKFAENEDFIFNSKDLTSYRSIYLNLKKGNYIKTPDFFLGECKYSYNENMGFTGKSNYELLSQLIEYVESMGKEILVYNSSCLGFPTYCVFIPTFSEVIFHSLSKKHNSFENAKEACKILRDLPSAKFDDYLLLMLHISEMRKLYDIYPKLFSFATCANLPLSSTNKEIDSFLLSISLAYVYYEMGNLSKALDHLTKAIPFINGEGKEYLVCIKRYLTMSLQGYGEEKIKSLINMFHTEATAKKAFSSFAKGTNPFVDFVLHCDLNSCENCRINSLCNYKHTMSLISIIKEKTKELSFDELEGNLEKYSPIK